jgi:type I restriction enzyme, S subunit
MTTTLGRHLERPNERFRREADGDQSVLYIGLEHIESDTGRLLEPSELPSAEISGVRMVFRPGDILYTRLRPYLNKVYLAETDGICSPELWVLRPSHGLMPRYAVHYLRSPAVLERVQQVATGANLPRIPISLFSQIPLPLPSPEEQERIADILEEADALRQARRVAAEATRSLTSAIFRKMFGDPLQNPMDWPLEPLSTLGELERGRSSHRPRNAPHLYDGPYPFIQTGDIVNSDGWIEAYAQTYSEAGLEQSRLWPKGTLCITIAAHIGHTGILTFDACFPDSIVGFTARTGVSVIYIQQCLQQLQPVLEEAAPQGLQRNINLTTLRSLKIPRPPEHLQAAFAVYAEKAHAVGLRQRDAIRLHADLYHAMAAQAFVGELTHSWREQHVQQPVSVPTKEIAPFLDLSDPEHRRSFREGLYLEAVRATESLLNALGDGAPAADSLVNQALEAVQPLNDRLQPLLLQDSRLALAELRIILTHLPEQLRRGLADGVSQLAVVSQDRIDMQRENRGQATTAALARECAEICAEIETASLEAALPQGWRSIQEHLDDVTISLLRSTYLRSYFRPEDLSQHGIGKVEAEEGLHLLAAMGFVRQIQIQGQICYRLILPDAEEQAVRPQALDV